MEAQVLASFVKGAIKLNNQMAWSLSKPTYLAKAKK